jgi:regulator of protease activity HflC (stomatin/prohibitin superfamily)
MGDLIRAIVEIIKYLWPIRVVKSYERGVRFIGGMEPRELKPGIYWHVPFFMSIDTLAIVQDVVDLDIQAITTKDGKSVVISANVAFRITDAVAHWTSVQDFAENFPRMACRHVSAKAREWTWDELLAHQKDLEKSLRETLNTRMARLGWGAEIDDVGLTDLVLARQWRMFQ